MRFFTYERGIGRDVQEGIRFSLPWDFRSFGAQKLVFIPADFPDFAGERHGPDPGVMVRGEV